MRLTDPGRAFLPYATRALFALAEGRRAVAELARGGAASSRSGRPRPSAHTSSRRSSSRFAQAHPNVRLTVRTGHSEEILGMVLGDEVEVGAIRSLRHPGIQTEPLYEERLVLVADAAAPVRNGAADRGRGALRRAADLFDRASSYHDLTAAFLREAGVVPRAVMELDNIEATKKMVLEGLGVALLPQSAVAAELEDGGLRAIEIVDAKPSVARSWSSAGAMPASRRA